MNPIFMPAFALITRPAKGLRVFACVWASGDDMVKLKSVITSAPNALISKPFGTLFLRPLFRAWRNVYKLSSKVVAITRKKFISAFNRACFVNSVIYFTGLTVVRFTANLASNVFTKFSIRSFSVIRPWFVAATFNGCFMATTGAEANVLMVSNVRLASIELGSATLACENLTRFRLHNRKSSLNNPVNSVDNFYCNVSTIEVNTEPSHSGNAAEGVTTNVWSLNPIGHGSKTTRVRDTLPGDDIVSTAWRHAEMPDKEPAYKEIDSGYDTLNIGAVDVITAAEYPWRQAAVNVAVSGLELRSNAGAKQIINLAKSKIVNAQRSFANALAADLYSDGSATNQLGGIQSIVADTPTNTVGGIDSSTWSFWKNIVQSAAAPLQGGAGITPGSTTIESLMLPLYLRLTRGADHPDLIVMSENYFTFFETSQTSIKRYASSDEAQGGFVSLKYKLADVVFDSAASGIPAAHAYFLNTDYLKFIAHSDANMTIMPELQAVNQDAMVTPILWQGNLVASARHLHGVMKS